jgi:hypothetical protein
MVSMQPAMQTFADKYDTMVWGSAGKPGMVDMDKFRSYTSKAGRVARDKMLSDVMAGKAADSNYLYTAYAPGGALFPLESSDKVSITTKAFYGSGAKHGWGNPRSAAIDLGTSGNDYIQYATGWESVMAGDTYIKDTWSPKGDYGTGYGYMFTTYDMTKGSPMTSIYGHLPDATNNIAVAIKNLGLLTQNAGLFYAPLPPGFSIGYTGTTGNSSGHHMHYEPRKGFYWW